MNFRPFNSIEPNLHLIRLSVASDASITSPSSNYLPDNNIAGSGTTFSVTKDNSSGNGRYIINYGSEVVFTEIPSAFCTVTNSGNNLIGHVHTLSKTGCYIYITNSSGNTATNSAFELTIIGPVRSGYTNTNTNKGWCISAQDSPNNIYTNMNVGIGVNNCSIPANSFGGLTLAGGLSSYFETVTPSSSNISMNYLISYLDGSAQSFNAILPDNSSAQNGAKNGQIKIIIMKVAGNNVSIPNTYVVSGGASKTITFNSQGDTIILVFNTTTNKWIPVGNRGCVLA